MAVPLWFLGVCLLILAHVAPSSQGKRHSTDVLRYHGEVLILTQQSVDQREEEIYDASGRQQSCLTCMLGSAQFRKFCDLGKQAIGKELEWNSLKGVLKKPSC